MGIKDSYQSLTNFLPNGVDFKALYEELHGIMGTKLSTNVGICRGLDNYGILCPNIPGNEILTE